MNARTGSGQLTDEFAAKAIEIPRIVPFYRRTWFRRLCLCLLCGAGLAGAAAIGFVSHWREERLADLERQRACLNIFLRSEEFAAFAQAMDRQLVALTNYVAAQPRAVRTTFPTVAAQEDTRRMMPWTLQVMPLPASAATEPERIVRACRDISRLLVQRGYDFDAAARTGARQMLLRTMSPYIRKFMEREPANGFPALILDRSLQDAALAEFGARHGVGHTVSEMERLFGIYAAIAPTMWQAIERDRAAGQKGAFTAQAASR
jgi:hypothetical protein